MKTEQALGIDVRKIEEGRAARSEAAAEAVKAGILPDPKKVDELPQKKQRYEVVRSERITGVSFVLDREEGKWMVTVGTRVISEKKFETLRKARRYVKKKPWEIVVTLCAAVSIMATTAERIFTNNEDDK